MSEEKTTKKESFKVQIMQIVRDYFYPIKFIAKGLLSWMRAIIGSPPRAEKARQKAQRKKAGA